MKLKEKDENYYVEAKIKDPGFKKWGEWLPLNSSETLEESEACVKDFISQNKELGDKCLWKYRIMKRVEKHYIVKTIIGGVV